MSEIWDRVHKLNGRTLHTLARAAPFRVVGVSSDRVEFVQQRSKNGTVRWFPRSDIEHFASLGLGRDEIRTRLMTEWPNDQNTSYVATIIYEITKPGASRSSTR